VIKGLAEKTEQGPDEKRQSTIKHSTKLCIGDQGLAEKTEQGPDEKRQWV
jgi:hypothetical protein